MNDKTTAIVIKTTLLVLFLFLPVLDSSGADGPSACFLGFWGGDGGAPETGGAGAGFDGGDTEGGGVGETEELNGFPSFLCQRW